MSFLRVYAGDALRDQIELKSDRFTIGRATDNDLVLESSGVSSYHAVIRREDDRFFVEDNHSTNGVFVNRKRVERAELAYWDEIQIFDCVLKFMARPRLVGEHDPDTLDLSANRGGDKTVVIDLSDDARLEQLSRLKKTARVLFLGKDGTEKDIVFKGPSVRVGKSRDCDIQIGGWFAPAVAAELERGADAYYLIPKPRGKVTLNGAKVIERTQIKDGDQIQVRGRRITFLHRVLDGA